MNKLGYDHVIRQILHALNKKIFFDMKLMRWITSDDIFNKRILFI